MMIAVQLGDKEVFDSLWNWAMTYMYVSDPRHPSHGYFSWSCKTDGTPNDETPALTAKNILRWPCCLRETAGRAEPVYTIITRARKLYCTPWCTGKFSLA